MRRDSMARRIERLGVRADQAAAEAVMAAELCALLRAVWPEAVDAIANDPSPAQRSLPLVPELVALAVGRRPA